MKDLLCSVICVFPFICLFILVCALFVFLAQVIFAEDDYCKPDADDWE